MKIIKGYKDYYVSKRGFVLSCKNNKKRILKPDNSKGYLRVVLSKNGKTKRFMIHRLVAQSFIRNSENKPEVNHIDGNKLNNQLNNLEWVTRSENEIHNFRILKRKVNKPWLGKTGVNNPSSKLVIQMDLDGNIIKKFGSAMEAARKLNKSNSHISSACRGVYETAYGYKWEYGVV